MLDQGTEPVEIHRLGVGHEKMAGIAHADGGEMRGCAPSTDGTSGMRSRVRAPAGQRMRRQSRTGAPMSTVKAKGASRRTSSRPASDSSAMRSAPESRISDQATAAAKSLPQARASEPSMLNISSPASPDRRRRRAPSSGRNAGPAHGPMAAGLRRRDAQNLYGADRARESAVYGRSCAGSSARRA